MSRPRLEHLTKSFTGGPAPVRAVDDLTLELADGELLALAGPSGCGKTTTLRLIAGLEIPDGGEIFLDGEPITRLPPEERSVALAFQNPALFPHLTIAENLALGPRLRKIPNAESAPRIAELTSALKLEPFLQRYPEQLSGGQQQRAALARALVLRPRLFLLDEPLANLDPAARQELRSEIKTLQRQLAVPLIYVTHDQAEAMALGDRIALLSEGRLQQAGTAAELYHTPENLFAASFFGTPPINLLPAELTAGQNGTLCRIQGFPEILLPHPILNPPRQAIAGIRPEHIQLGSPGIAATLIEAIPAFPDWHLRLQAGPHLLWARPRAAEYSAQSPLDISLSPSRLLLFHLNGPRLSSGG